MKTEIIKVINPAGVNLIFGQSHFVKTVEDLHELLVTSVPGVRFGLAFCEASGDRLVRTSGTSDGMVKLAAENAMTVGCGHTFFIFLENAFPINVLNAVKMTPEVARIFCATANQLEVVVAVSNQGRGVLGVIDGGAPLGIESKTDKTKRKAFLRKIGYKL
jgi:hypothetical protein